MKFLINTLLSALIISFAAELGKRSSLLAAIVISLPLSSMLALSFLYADTKDTGKVIAFSYGILWLILPSLAFFLILPQFLKWGMNYWGALALSAAAMVVIYTIYSWTLSRFGVVV